jgi:hypothetical protein
MPTTRQRLSAQMSGILVEFELAFQRDSTDRTYQARHS